MPIVEISRRTDRFSPQELRRQAERICASVPFSGSSRMTRFLNFVVEETLAGNADALKETTIAMAVFDRRADFDPRIDPIVRVEARRLRAKLHAYYASCAGPGELAIAIPAGGYRPEFLRRDIRQDPDVRRVYVQPFSTLTACAEDQFLAQGITQEIIHQLTAVPGLHVVAESGDNGWLVDGRVQRAKERVRVFVSALREPLRDYAWSERFETQDAESFLFQERIATTVRKRLFDPPGRLALCATSR